MWFTLELKETQSKKSGPASSNKTPIFKYSVVSHWCALFFHNAFFIRETMQRQPNRPGVVPGAGWGQFGNQVSMRGVSLNADVFSVLQQLALHLMGLLSNQSVDRLIQRANIIIHELDGVHFDEGRLPERAQLLSELADYVARLRQKVGSRDKDGMIIEMSAMYSTLAIARQTNALDQNDHVMPRLLRAFRAVWEGEGGVDVLRDPYYCGWKRMSSQLKEEKEAGARHRSGPGY